MRVYPIFIQDEEMSCGAYCILMILKYYGYQEEISLIKKKTRMSQNGISIKGMIECFKEYQIESKAYEASLDDIKENAQLPCILHTIDNGCGHYVVLYDIKDDIYTVGDPAKGIEKYHKEEIERLYSQRVILITHVGRVPELTYQSYKSFIYNLYFSYRQYMKKLCAKGFLIALFTYLCSFFYSIIFDVIDVDTHYFYLILLCVTYGTTLLMKTFITHKQNEEVIKISRVLDEDIAFDSFVGYMSKPISFYMADKGQISGQILSLSDLSQFIIMMFCHGVLDGMLIIVLMGGMMLLSLSMSLLVLVMLGIIVLLSHRYYIQVEQMHKHYLESYYDYHHHLLEMIDNRFLIHRHALNRDMRKRSFNIYSKQADLAQDQSLYTNDFNRIIQVIIYLFTIFILLLGFYLYQSQKITMGEFLMFYMLMSYIVEPVMNLIEIKSHYSKTKSLFEKYKGFKVKNEDKNKMEGRITSVTLDNVGFSHGYQLPLFEHLDYTIKSHTLITGETGCGKSTLLKLMMGFDDQYTGDIFFNHQELRTIDLNSLYRHIGFLNESPSFFNLSLYDNFLCDDEGKIRSLLKCFHQEDLADMFHITLNEDGSPLSLGQRQVVSLIRVLCQDYDVIIFDEAFSHMDRKLVTYVNKYLTAHDEGKIYIMVDHHIRTLKKGWDMITIDNSKKSVV